MLVEAQGDLPGRDGAGLLERQRMVEDLDLGAREEKPEPAKAKVSGMAFGLESGLPKMG